MPTLFLRIRRRLRHDKFVRSLTMIGFFAIGLLLWCDATPIKASFCKANLPKAQFAFDIAGFSTAQAIVCSEKEIQPKEDEWNLSYHQGGNGPWIPKVNGVVNDNLVLPTGCIVDQVHMLARHAERYPTKDAGERHLNLLKRLKTAPNPVTKSLAFVKNWKYFTNPGSPDFESLIRSGRYPGTTEALNTGAVLRSRYLNLVHPNQSTTFWSASSPRDVETAEWFAKGFFGETWNKTNAATLSIIPETADRGADTLTPGKTCPLYQNDTDQGRQTGYTALSTWQDTFTPPITHRLASPTGPAPGFNFTPQDIYSMFEICGFEILVRGVSPWCPLFTNTDWLDFEYGRDLLHYYRAGPGNAYAPAMGLLWLDAVAKNLANETDAAKRMHAAFVHDGDIVPLIAALALLDEPRDPATSRPARLPAQHRKWDRLWRTSDVVPMGGRVLIERVRCDAGRGDFVRLIINDGHMAMADRGVGELLPRDLTLEGFGEMVRAKKEEFGDFRAVCGLDPDQGPEGVEFLHQQ